jgi:hypothetical protein
LLHIDTKRFARFARPGHAVTGDRHITSAERRMRLGYEWVHSLIDDHSRLAYSELHRDERAETITGFVERGLAFFGAMGSHQSGCSQKGRNVARPEEGARERAVDPDAKERRPA